MPIKKFDTKEYNILTIVDGDNNKWFKGVGVAKILGYSNKQKAVRDHVKLEDKQKRGNFRRPNNMEPLVHNEKNQIFINERGLKSLIRKSRMCKASELAKTFGIDLLNHKYECKESETIGAIIKSFSGEKMIQQHSVLDYRLDLYFPDYNLAIECDENNHNDRNISDERRRQRRITKKIKCQWVRFNPDSEDFNIFQIINKIFIIIKTKSTLK